MYRADCMSSPTHPCLVSVVSESTRPLTPNCCVAVLVEDYKWYDDCVAYMVPLPDVRASAELMHNLLKMMVIPDSAGDAS